MGINAISFKKKPSGIPARDSIPFDLLKYSSSKQILIDINIFTQFLICFSKSLKFSCSSYY